MMHKLESSDEQYETYPDFLFGGSLLAVERLAESVYFEEGPTLMSKF